MRDATDIQVQRAIVHVIDHLKQEVTFSELELDLNENAALGEYFASQVANALRDDKTGSARFVADGDRSAADACYRILGDGKQLVGSSQKLATLLMNAMGTDARIMSGDLAVCLFTAANYPATPFLALIKIDPGNALVQKIEMRNGKRVVTFDVRANVLPSTREKLQKAALVPPAGRYDKFDLLLLDQQVPEVAAFFALAFLNATTALDAPRATETFHRVLHDATKQLRLKPPSGVEPISVEDSVAVLAHGRNAMKQRKVSISSFVAALPLEKKARAVVRERLKKAFPEEGSIEIDKERAQKLLKKQGFKGDYGVLFEVDDDHYHEVVRDMTRNPDNASVTDVWIQVTNLQWVK
jgi:hypothetical protein